MEAMDLAAGPAHEDVGYGTGMEASSRRARSPETSLFGIPLRHLLASSLPLMLLVAAPILLLSSPSSPSPPPPPAAARAASRAGVQLSAQSGFSSPAPRYQAPEHGPAMGGGAGGSQLQQQPPPQQQYAYGQQQWQGYPPPQPYAYAPQQQQPYQYQYAQPPAQQQPTWQQQAPPQYAPQQQQQRYPPQQQQQRQPPPQQYRAPVPEGKDEAALSYAGESDKKATLHALALASREGQRLRAPKRETAATLWDTNQISGEAAKTLQGLRGGGSQVTEARQRISKVLEQSVSDKALRKSVLKGAAEAARGTGDTWNRLLSHQVGPQSMQKASDWLSTEVLSGGKAKQGPHAAPAHARAQLEAALSRVGGHFDASRQREAATGGARGGPAGLAFEKRAARHVMGATARSESRGQLFGGGYRGGEEGGQGGGGGRKPPSGAAPGLSSYDQQILAGGPPS